MPLAVFPKCYIDRLTSGAMTLEEWIDLVAEHLDVDGLELYTPLLRDRSRAALVELRDRAEAAGLAIPMMCHSPDFTAPDPAERRRQAALQVEAIRITQLLGGRYCRVLSGQRWPGLGEGTGVRRAVAGIRASLPEAERRGVVLVLENHYKDGSWAHPEFAMRRETYLRVLDGAGPSEWLAVNFDPSNALIAEEDPLTLLEAVRHRVATVHASDRYRDAGGRLQHGIVGEGMNDYDAIFSMLAEAGFRGWISIEDGIDPEGGVERLQRSAEFVRAKMAQHGLA